jgi:hypothetical protein
MEGLTKPADTMQRAPQIGIIGQERELRGGFRNDPFLAQIGPNRD